MSGSTEEHVRQGRQADDALAAREWLDALASGACDQDAFLRAIDAQLRAEPDAAWEVLSLLDRYYRRGKISAEQFELFKSRFARQVLGAGKDVQSSAPPGDNGVRVPGLGEVLRGRYRLQAILGQGRMGTVFEALDEYRVGLPTVGQRLALKLLHAEVAARPEFLGELLREFKEVQSLSHPNIVRVHEFDRDGELAFFTMELLQGTPLSRLLGANYQRTLDRSQALAIIRDVGAALAHAHSRGVIHGDVRPENIYITDAGEVRLVDFGAANTLLCGPRISDVELPQHTAVATTGYATRALLEGRQPDERDDLYALACVAYQLLAGQHPWPTHTVADAVALRTGPRRPAGLTRRQWQALRAGLSRDRGRRPSNVQQWLERFDLRAAAARLPKLPAPATAPPPATGSARVAAVSALVVMLVAGGLWVTVDSHLMPQRAMALSADLRAVLAGGGAFIARQWARARGGAGIANDNDALPRPPEPGSPTADVADAGAAPISGRRREAALAAAAAVKPSPAPAGTSPPSRIELAADTVEVPAAEPLARVTVRRTGDLHRDVTFRWWTESGSAQAGDDFASFGPRTEHIQDGQDGVRLLVPLVSDSTRRRPTSLFVVIGDPGPGASLGARTRTMVIIPAAD
jgi:serine/threonine protein kinase